MAAEAECAAPVISGARSSGCGSYWRGLTVRQAQTSGRNQSGLEQHGGDPKNSDQSQSTRHVPHPKSILHRHRRGPMALVSFTPEGCIRASPLRTQHFRIACEIPGAGLQILGYADQLYASGAILWGNDRIHQVHIPYNWRVGDGSGCSVDRVPLGTAPPNGAAGYALSPITLRESRRS